MKIEIDVNEKMMKLSSTYRKWFQEAVVNKVENDQAAFEVKNDYMKAAERFWTRNPPDFQWPYTIVQFVVDCLDAKEKSDAWITTDGGWTNSCRYRLFCSAAEADRTVNYAKKMLSCALSSMGMDKSAWGLFIRYVYWDGTLDMDVAIKPKPLPESEKGWEEIKA